MSMYLFNATTKKWDIEWKGISGAALVSPRMAATQFFSSTLIDGTAVIAVMVNGPINGSVWANPAVGDTITISFSADGGLSYPAAANITTTVAWSAGLASAVTHIKFQRTSGAGTTSACGVVQ